MDVTNEIDDEQTKLWNGVAGRAWVESQALLDEMFKPFDDLLVKAVSTRPRHQILDVGCGTGSTTLAVARAIGANGRCTGIDISEPMLIAARSRAGREGAQTAFIRANAQVYTFEPASFDMIISRFGVMFFDDPVKAFANLRRSGTDQAGLSFVAWRDAEENPFMTTAERAAAPLLPNLPVRQPGGRGQFAFADKQSVHSILEQSHWTGIEIQPIDINCGLREKELITFLTRFGPVGRVLEQADSRTRALVIETVRSAFNPYVRGAEVHFVAACWMVSAEAGPGMP